MLAFICLFFPAATSVFIYEAVTKKEYTAKQSILRFCTNALIINLLCMLVKKFVFGTAANPLYAGDMVPNVAITYIVMALFFAVVIALIEAVFSKKATVSVEEEVNEEEKKD